MKFNLETLTGKIIFTREGQITWPTMPFLAASVLKPVPPWQVFILWLCGLIGQALAQWRPTNGVPLRHKLLFLAIVASIVIPVLIERLRF